MMTNGQPDPGILMDLMTLLRADISSEDISTLLRTVREWQAAQHQEMWTQLTTNFAPHPLNGAARAFNDDPVGTFTGFSSLIADTPGPYMEGLRSMINADLSLLRQDFVRKPMLAIWNDPLLRLEWDQFLLKQRLNPEKFWGALQELDSGAQISEPLLAAKDFLLEEDEKIDWLVEGLVATGTLVLLAGPPKAGKSTFARHLLMSVLTGTPFLGRKAQKGTVLLYSLEDPHKVSGKHFGELGLLPSMPLWGRLTHENGPFLDTLRRDVSEVSPDLVVVDTMNVALDIEDMNNMVETTRKMTPLRQLTRETNATILLLAHTRKTSTGSALDILGSTGIRAAPDVNMVYHHDEETDIRYLRTEGKLGTHFKHVSIALEAGRCTLGPYSHLSHVDSAMLQTLTSEPGHTLSHSQWLRACKAGTREKRAEAIARLQREGLVTSARGEKNAMRYTVFSPNMG